MRRLTRYVLVTESGNWLHMADSYQEVEPLLAGNPGTHLERWVYPVLPDGTHGAPSKERC